MTTALRFARCAAYGFAVLCLTLPGNLRAQEAPPLPAGDQCVACHLDVEELPADFSRFDVHLQEGLSCVGCHGGDPSVDDAELAKAPGTGFIGIPARGDIPSLCGRCHTDPGFMHDFQPQIRTDQTAQYYISMHGQKLRDGDENVATCASCHTAHGILPARDARATVHALKLPGTCNTCHGDADLMRPYGIRTNQHSEFVKSVHGKALLERQDLGAPACNDCHGNHGALPPNVTSLAHVCGSCHLNNQQYFEESPMSQPFAEDELHACIECHGDHGVEKTSDDMTGIGDVSICLDCHEEGEDAYEAARQISAHLTGLVAAYDSATVRQEEVVRIGMDDVEINYILREARQNLVHARTLVHTFDPDKVGAETNEGLASARAALQLSAKQLDEHRKRRYGFGLATVFITMLALGLYLKIREIESRETG